MTRRHPRAPFALSPARLALPLLVVAVGSLAACQLPDAHPAQPAAQAAGPGYPMPPGYPAPPGYPQGYPPGYGPAYAPPGNGAAPPPGYGAPPGNALPGQPVGPGPQPVVAPASSRPLLGALVGAAMWQAEVRGVVGELEVHLTPEQQTLVAGIPLVFDPDATSVNAFAGCDDSGAPFVAGTEGLLETIDAIAQTRATDELFGTRTYDAYTHAVAPQLVSSQTATPALPLNIIPVQYLADARRLSRAHEMFDEIAAFTFGHELAHHYRGHTGCAHGQPSHVLPAVADLGRFLSSAVRPLNQLNENEADQWGCFDVLATGRARQPAALGWTEEGGLWLFDFFARLEGAAGGGAGVFSAFLSTHPSPSLRIPLVQADATVWRLQHPG